MVAGENFRTSSFETEYHFLDSVIHKSEHLSNPCINTAGAEQKGCIPSLLHKLVSIVFERSVNKPITCRNSRHMISQSAVVNKSKTRCMQVCMFRTWCKKIDYNKHQHRCLFAHTVFILVYIRRTLWNCILIL